MELDQRVIISRSLSVDLWNLVGAFGRLRMRAEFCRRMASPLAWRRPLSIPRTLRSLPWPNGDLVLMASLLEGQAHCSTVSDRNPPPPSFPRRACPVLDTGRESIPGMVRHHNPGSSPTRRPSILGGESRSDDRAGFKLAPTSHNPEVPLRGASGGSDR